MTLRSMLVAAAMAALIPASAMAQPIDPKVQARIDRILKATPLIDGHNDSRRSCAKITAARPKASRAALSRGSRSR